MRGYHMQRVKSIWLFPRDFDASKALLIKKFIERDMKFDQGDVF